MQLQNTTKPRYRSILDESILFWMNNKHHLYIAIFIRFFLLLLGNAEKDLQLSDVAIYIHKNLFIMSWFTLLKI